MKINMRSRYEKRDKKKCLDFIYQVTVTGSKILNTAPAEDFVYFCENQLRKLKGQSRSI